MKTEEEFDIFYIDMNRLEEQAAEHAFLYVQYCKSLKDAKQELSQEKAIFDLVVAELSLKIGRNPKKYRLLEKPTSAMITNKILTRSKYKDALKVYQSIQDLVSTFQIYVNAFEHRKKMISEAVNLHGQQYFAKPYIATSEIKEVVDMLEKKRLRNPKKGKAGKK